MSSYLSGRNSSNAKLAFHVNISFMQRLKKIRVENAALNAIVKLDSFGNNITFLLNGDLSNSQFNDVEKLFDAYLKEND